MRIRQFLAVLMLAAAPVLVFAVDDDDDIAPIALPEPATLALLGAGLAAIVVTRTSKRKQ